MDELFFFSVSCLISLARISNTMLNRSGDSGQTCLVPDFRREKLQPFIVEYVISCGLVIYDFYYIDVIFFYAQFVHFLIQNMLNFGNLHFRGYPS